MDIRQYLIDRKRLMCFLIFFLCCFYQHSILAQTDLFQSGASSSLKFDEGSGKSIGLAFSPQLFAIDGPIDPEQYFVGPGDLLNIGIWTSTPMLFPVQINMEGSVIIPTIGEVNVSGSTLTQAKKLIIQKVKTKFVSSEVTATLAAPRTFLISVTGAVLNQGTYPIRAGSRAGIAVKTATQSDSIHADKIEQILDRISIRKIQLLRKNETIRVDLVRFMATGLSRYNPLLADGDRLLIPRKDEVLFLSIYGAVTNEGKLEYVEGDSLSHIIQYAGGVLESADLENIQISRLDENGKLKETITINYKELLSGKSMDVRLEKNDRIFVPYNHSLKKDYKIYIDGEIKYKGTYPITKNETKLGDILRKIRLKDQSDLGNGFIIRNVKYENIEYLFPYLLRKNFGLSREDSMYFNQEAELLSMSKFISINLDEVYEGKTDIDLVDGDYIFIPSKQIPTVYIFGQVNNPGFLPFKKGENYKYYVTSANGFSQLARQGDVKVIKRKTYSWVNAKDADIEPGDFIFVTKKIIHNPGYYWSISKDIILTVGAIASTVATIVLISRTN
jgi:polysaccharide biosynthesis/export protein